MESEQPNKVLLQLQNISKVFQVTSSSGSTNLFRIGELANLPTVKREGNQESNKPSTKSNYVHAVDDVSLEIRKGEIFGLVGESGCGKSTLGRICIGLLEPESGHVFYDGVDVFKTTKKIRRKLRARLQLVFQDAGASLDPRYRVSSSIAEALNASGQKSSNEKILELLELVGLQAQHMNRYPHQLSGGEKQRVVIARALATSPEFIVADEPVSALDVSIRAQVLNLLLDLQKKFGLTYLFITHDLSVVRYISDRVAVMYLGQIVEIAETEDLYKNPCHPYTLALLAAIPDIDLDLNSEIRSTKVKFSAKGVDLPSPLDPPSGCRYHTRCPMAMEICKQRQPELIEVWKGHYAACHLLTEKQVAQSKLIGNPISTT